MKRYNIFKNIIIALLAASFYFYVCITDNELFTVIVATIGVFLTIYLAMSELDTALFVRKQRQGNK